MTTPLLILGASVRAAAQSALRAGLVPRAVDLFGDADLRACCAAERVEDYPDDLLAAATAAPPSPWMYTGALENYPELVEDLAARRPLWGNRGETLCRVRDPLELAHALARHGFAYPETRSAPPEDGDRGRWLRKPRRSSGGMGIAFWDGGPSGAAAGYCFQRYCEGTPCAAIFVASAGRAALLGVTEQLCGAAWAGAAPFHYCGSIGPLPFSDAEEKELARLGNVLSAEFELAGLFGVDGILADGVFTTVEINPRYTASVEILERTLDAPALALHRAACTGDSIQWRPQPPSHLAGKAILYARQKIPPRDELCRQILAAQRGRTWPTVADIPAPGTPIAAQSPVLTLFAEGKARSKVEAELRQAVREWEERLGG